MFVSCREFDILDEAVDVLLLAARAYHQHIVGVYDDIVLESAYDCGLVLGYED